MRLPVATRKAVVDMRRLFSSLYPIMPIACSAAAWSCSVTL